MAAANKKPAEKTPQPARKKRVVTKLVTHQTPCIVTYKGAFYKWTGLYDAGRLSPKDIAFATASYDKDNNQLGMDRGFIVLAGKNTFGYREHDTNVFLPL